MKSSRTFLLFAILSIVIISSFADEETVSHREKDDIPLENKKTSTPPSDKPERQRPKHRKQQQQQRPHQDLDDIEDTEDYSAFLSGYAGNQYTASQGAEGNQRAQSRWPQQKRPSQQHQQQQMTFRFVEPELNEWNDADEWNGIEFPNNPVPVNLPHMPFNTPQVSDNGPTCYSLVDPQYPIFSDVCGAVPQARYSLPNAFGYSERWQIAQLLTNVVGSSTDSGCTRSLRLLLCPVLFPPCQSRQESAPVLPCQSYCRAVKSRCSIPALDALSCESLPYVSDICPTNQAYGSFLPPTSQSSHHQQTKSNADLQAANYQLSRTLASLQSLLASQGLQSQLNPSLLPQQPQQPINPSLLSQQTLQSQLNPSLLSQQTSQTNQQKNLPTFAQQQQQHQPTLNSRSPYSPETLSAMYAELSGHHPFVQNQRYPTQLTRSSNEARAQPEARFANLAFPRMANPSAALPTGIPSGIPSLVKA